jgi:flagellar basal body-associated protein FliL
MDISWIGPASLVLLWVIGVIIVLTLVAVLTVVFVNSARNTMRADAIKKASAAGLAAENASRSDAEPRKEQHP